MQAPQCTVEPQAKQGDAQSERARDCWDLNINFNSIYFYIKRWKIFHQLCTRASERERDSSENNNKNKNKNKRAK